MRSWHRLLWSVTVAALAGAAPARAIDGCSGQYSATALQPLPVPAVAKLQLFDDSPANQQLARAFTDGMSQSGLAVSGTPTVSLSVTHQIYANGGSGGGSGGGASWGGQDSWDAMQGGVSLERPDMPRYDTFSPAPSVQSGLLVLRVDLRDLATNAIDWVAVFQCTLQGGDQNPVAYGIGYLVGQSAGRRVSRAPM
jgi:hypothetical protein